MADIGDYRYRVPGGANNEPRINLNGVVLFDVFIERMVDDDPEEVWEQIDMGHLSIGLPGASLEQCNNAQEAKDLLAQQILDKGLAQAHRARQAMVALLPGGEWPENDITQILDM